MPSSRMGLNQIHSRKPLVTGNLFFLKTHGFWPTCLLIIYGDTCALASKTANLVLFESFTFSRCRCCVPGRVLNGASYTPISTEEELTDRGFTLRKPKTKQSFTDDHRQSVENAVEE